MKAYGRGLVQGKIKITIRRVNIKYLVHSIEWGVDSAHDDVCGTVWVIYFLVIF
jgi:hypothetical protein